MNRDAPALEALVREAVARTTVDATTSSFSWFGRRETACPAPLRRALTAAQLRDALVHALAARLYECFYSAGRAVKEAPRVESDSEDPAWLARLGRANRSTECRDEGWTALRREGRTLVVRKNGLILRIDRRDACAAGRGQSIVLPSEYRKLSPGYYLAASNAPWPLRAPLFRVYFNLTAEGAPRLVRWATGQLNAAGLPFRLKVADHPGAFERCDSGVLYVARRDRRALFAQLPRISRALAPYLEPATPVFTRAIAPGIAVAEDPLTGESFGENRCRVLAEALIRSAGPARETDRRFEDVRSLFSRRGIPFHRVHLNPGSADAYPQMPASPRSVKRPGYPPAAEMAP